MTPLAQAIFSASVARQVHAYADICKHLPDDFDLEQIVKLAEKIATSACKAWEQIGNRRNLGQPV